MRKVADLSWRLALCALILICSFLTLSNARAQFPDDQPETVHITFHVQKGHEEEMKKILTDAWQAYTQQDMVVPSFHVVLKGNENGNPYFIEIFTWRNHDIPDHMPAQVQAIWKQMNAMCEKRGNKPAIEGGEVQLLIPHS